MLKKEDIEYVRILPPVQLEEFDSIKRKICRKQGKLFQTAHKMGFDEDDFVRQYMNSEFCNLEMDSVYSHYHITDTMDAMDELLQEIAPKKQKLQKPRYTEFDMDAMGYLYRYICFRCGIRSYELYKTLPVEKMHEYADRLMFDGEEYVMDELKEEGLIQYE